MKKPNKFRLCILAIVLIGLITTTDAQWSVFNLPPGGKSIEKIKFYNDSIGIMVGRAGTIYRSMDKGGEWQLINSNTDREIFDLQLTNYGFYAVGFGGIVLKSFDLGLTWNTSYVPLFRYYSQCIWFTDSLNGMVAGWDTLYLTTNAGQSWNFVPIRESVYQSFHFMSKDTGYASGYYWPLNGPFSAVFRTVNGGRSWDTVKCVVGEELYEMCFIGDTGYAAGEHTMVFKTTDRGRSWFLPRPVRVPFYEWYYGITFATSNLGWAAGGRDGIYRTTDGGVSWQLQFSYDATEPQYQVSKAIFALDTMHIFAAGFEYSSGKARLLKTTNGGVTFIDEPVETGAETTISELYPNPAADEIGFSVTATEPGNYTYLVHSVLGEQIHPLTLFNATEGKNTVKINTKQLAPGVYFLRVAPVSGKNPVRVKKFIVNR